MRVALLQSTEFARDPTCAILRKQRGLGSCKHRKELSKLSGLPLPSEPIYHLAASPWGYQSKTVIKKDRVIVFLGLGSSRREWGTLAYTSGNSNSNRLELKRPTTSTSLGVWDTDLLSVVSEKRLNSLQARSKRVIQGTWQCTLVSTLSHVHKDLHKELYLGQYYIGPVLA